MPRVKQFDEEEVLDKAMELFWRKGYHATSVQDLVDALQINRASIYNAFGDKRQLFERVVKRYQDVNQTATHRFLQGFTSVKEGLQAMFHHAIEEAITDKDRKGCFVVNTTTEMDPDDPILQELVTENKRNFEIFLRGYLQHGVDNGEIDPDKDLAAIATLVFTLYNGLRVVGKFHQDREALQAMIHTGLSVLD